MDNALGEAQTIVLFGGTSDIGRAIVDALVSPATTTVVLAARRPDDVDAVSLGARGVNVDVVPFDGELSCDHLHGLTPGAYRCGQVWGIRIEVAGTSFYHQGSANLVDDARDV